MARRNKTAEIDLFEHLEGEEASFADSTSGAALISPFIAETREMLAQRKMSLGNMLASDRAVEYLSILRALASFREEHEPEPLHEDVFLRVCGETADATAETIFKNDIRQLKAWDLIKDRIEKERLRGYRDNRRTKFRYLICEDAVAFIEWLSMRYANDLEPRVADETGNRLDFQRSLLAELQRMLERVNPNAVEYETASDIFFRVDQMSQNINTTIRVLQELNLKLLSFGTQEFSPDEAKALVAELGLFLERFGRRFSEFRKDITNALESLQKERHVKRWNACRAVLEQNANRFQHLVTVKIPDTESILARASAFYESDGKLTSLLSRVVTSARKVWGRLNAKLRELERRNHRLEDLSARMLDLAQLSEDQVPHRWLTHLLGQSAIRGDAYCRPRGERSSPPLPRKSSTLKTQQTHAWITPRNVGEKTDVVSITQERARRLKEWMIARQIVPTAQQRATQLSVGNYCDFEDFSKIMQVIEAVRLGGGERAARNLSIKGTPISKEASVTLGEATLTFEDLILQETRNPEAD